MIEKVRFLGAHIFRLDAKCRFRLVPLWRLEVGSSLYLLPTERYGMRVINVCNQAGFDEKMERIDTSDLAKEKKSRLRQALSTHTRLAIVDGKGRILIPLDLRSRCGITAKSEVVLAGRYLHFEIWNKESFDIMNEIEAREMGDFDALGIF